MLVDGLRPDVAEAELAAGRLPNFARLTRTGGVGRAITAFPSSTGVSYVPFLAGATPGRANTPSIRWLERTKYQGRWWRERDLVRSYCGYQAGMLNADLSPDIRTIFELIPDSAAIFTMVGRGLLEGRDLGQGARQLWGGLAHFTHWYQALDEIAGREMLKAVDRDWRFVFVQFPAVDGYTHPDHPSCDRVLHSLHRVDTAVGALLDRLEAKGELDQTFITMVSDHGAAQVHTHLDLADWFRRQGVPTLSHPVLWERAPRAAVMIAGNGSAMVYARPGLVGNDRLPLSKLREPEAFGSRDDLIARLILEPAVAMVVGEEAGGGVRVANADGEAVLTRPSPGSIRYRPVIGDPLGLGPDQERSDQEWLEATWDGPFPDAPYQLLDPFRSSRTGDLVVIAREGFDLRSRFEIPEHKSGHGSLIRSHMQTPLWSNRPLPAQAVRTTEVYGALLSWLGVTAAGPNDCVGTWTPGVA